MTVYTLPPADCVDVLIVGAGISGIGMARYLQKAHPQKRFQILEARMRLGGTWDLFRYPGIRSDSDLYTFGYEFKPWTDDKAIADAGAILDYLREAATETGVDRHIRYGQRVVSADWRSELAQWSVQVEDLASGQRRSLSCRWLFSAAGYYRYDEGFSPRFEGMDRFQGRVVHPQHWPDDLDYSGQRVVVIGSGATAITLIPAMIECAQHVTMLQRTPSYVMALPAKDPIALALRRLLPETLAYRLTRYKNVSLSRGIWRFCQRHPKLSRRLLRFFTRKALPVGYPVDEHFNPPYDPWDQRLCAAPDGDFFKALASGRASIVTDRIETFTERGLRLKSGRELQADLIVTATGLNLQMFGGIRLSLDGQPVAMDQTVTYKGMMLSGVPNFAFAIGYTNSSWTLKVGLLCEHFCRLLEHMDRKGYASVRAQTSPELATRPLLDFGAGYVQRALCTLPRQGAGRPWVMSMDYFDDVKVLRKGPVTDPHLHFQELPIAAAHTAGSARTAGVRA